jgi:hypothetical protein
VRSITELGDILADCSATDTSVAVDIDEVSEGDDDLLDLLSQLASRSKDECLGLLDRGVNLLSSARSSLDILNCSPSGGWKRRKWRSCPYRIEPVRYSLAQK